MIPCGSPGTPRRGAGCRAIGARVAVGPHSVSSVTSSVTARPNLDSAESRIEQAMKRLSHQWPCPWAPPRRGIPTAAQVLEQQRRDHADDGFVQRCALAVNASAESQGGTTPRQGGAQLMSNIIATTNGFGGASSAARALQGTGLKFKDNE